MNHNFPCEQAEIPKIASFIVPCLLHSQFFILIAYVQSELCVFKTIKLDVHIRSVFADWVAYAKIKFQLNKVASHRIVGYLEPFEREMFHECPVVSLFTRKIFTNACHECYIA